MQAPSIAQRQIAEWVDEDALARGREYAARRALFDLQRRGALLRARCEGSRETPYRLSVRLGAGGVEAAECSCPVGAAGRCKHVAALLLLWEAHPGEFGEAEDLSALLQRRAKADLVALIMALVAQEPELEDLVELQLDPHGGRAARLVRQQVAASFRKHGGRFGAPARIADELDRLVSQANGLLQHTDPEGAAGMYGAILSELSARYRGVHDEDGALHHVISSCVEGLGRCLPLLQGNATRGNALAALFSIYRLDVDAGGLALGDEAPEILAREARPDERRLLAGWVREALSSAGDWSRAVYGGFLLDVEAELLDDESFLRICQETGRTYDRVVRLLSLGRAAEAAEAGRRASDYDLLRVAELLLRHQQREEAEALLSARLERSQDPRLFDLLQRSVLDRGDLSGALDLARRRFLSRPDLAGYRALRTLASRAARWDEVRPALLDRLRAQHADLLRQILVEEGDFPGAFSLLPPLRAGGYLENYPQLLTAEAAEATHPRESRRLYLQYAALQREAKARPAYREACKYLLRARALAPRAGESAELGAEWLSHAAADLHLAEELRAAGLLE